LEIGRAEGLAMQDEDLDLFARQLTAEGIEAYGLAVPVPGKGNQVGLMVVGAGFFPLWELNEPQNVGMVATREFAAIKAKRPPNWELVEPQFWDKPATAKGE
jgi:hypothetical protein